MTMQERELPSKLPHPPFPRPYAFKKELNARPKATTTTTARGSDRCLIFVSPWFHSACGVHISKQADLIKEARKKHIGEKEHFGKKKKKKEGRKEGRKQQQQKTFTRLFRVRASKNITVDRQY